MLLLCPCQINQQNLSSFTFLFVPYSFSPSQTALQTAWFSSSGAGASWWVGGSLNLLLSSPLWSQTMLDVAWRDGGYTSMNELFNSAPTCTKGNVFRPSYLCALVGEVASRSCWRNRWALWAPKSRKRRARRWGWEREEEGEASCPPSSSASSPSSSRCRGRRGTMRPASGESCASPLSLSSCQDL